MKYTLRKIIHNIVENELNENGRFKREHFRKRSKLIQFYIPRRRFKQSKITKVRK